MAVPHLKNPLVITAPVLLFFLQSLSLHSCHQFNPNINISKVQHYSDWSPAAATWYGSPDGAGSNGGACGFGDDVHRAQFHSMISAGGPSLFMSGKGCGACYQVKCTSNAACSWNPVTVVITDECPGCTEPVHFDLSGTAFGAMARRGLADQLRNAGVLQIQYKRVPCSYPGKTVTFHVDKGSNPYYFAVLVEYADGDGEISSVELKQASGSSWQPMQQSWGAIWKLNSGSPLQGPLSLRLTSADSRKTIEAINTIPANWQPGNYYASLVNF